MRPATYRLESVETTFCRNLQSASIAAGMPRDAWNNLLSSRARPDPEAKGASGLLARRFELLLSPQTLQR